MPVFQGILHFWDADCRMFVKPFRLSSARNGRSGRDIPGRQIDTPIKKSATLTLLKYRMSAAFAVIAGRRIPATVVVIQHNVFAFVPNNVGNTFKIFRMFGDHK